MELLFTQKNLLFNDFCRLFASVVTVLCALYFSFLWQVLECGEEKVLVLTEVERVKALAAQLVKLLRAQRSSSLRVGQLLSEYSKTFGYGLRLQDYDASTLPALLAKLCHVVKVTQAHFVLNYPHSHISSTCALWKRVANGSAQFGNIPFFLFT